MAVLPPAPKEGKSIVETPYGYQIKAGCAGGSSVRPVLFLELLIGLAGSNASPDLPVA